MTSLRKKISRQAKKKTFRAECREPDCNHRQGPSADARQKRQCDSCFKKAQDKKARAEARRQLPCAREGCRRPRGKNDLYCSKTCAQLARSFIDHPHIRAITATSCWSSAEKAIQNSSCGLASVDGLPGIVALLRLCERKEQLSLIFDLQIIDDIGGSITFQRCSAMELHLCHLVANSAGGLNQQKNIIAGPACINQALLRKIYVPESAWSQRLFAHRISQQKGTSLKSRTPSGKTTKMALLAALHEQGQYSKEDIVTGLLRWQPLQHPQDKHIHFRLPPEPLTRLLCDELGHCGGRAMLKIRAAVRVLARRFANQLEGYMEVIAIAAFIALQTCDHHGLLRLLYNSGKMAHACNNHEISYVADGNHHNLLGVYEGGALYPLISKTQEIIRYYLKIRPYQHKALLRFYLGIFTIPPVTLPPVHLVLIKLESPHHITRTSVLNDRVLAHIYQTAEVTRKTASVTHATLAGYFANRQSQPEEPSAGTRPEPDDSVGGGHHNNLDDEIWMARLREITTQPSKEAIW